jgi:hypothetical protein
MEFQVLDKTGNAIAINELDRQAAEFWGVEVHKKRYACPKGYGERMTNWFDIVGFAITQQGNYTRGWKNVALYLLESLSERIIDFDKKGIKFIEMDSYTKKVESILEFYKPFFELMTYWDECGYTPKKL